MCLRPKESVFLGEFPALGFSQEESRSPNHMEEMSLLFCRSALSTPCRGPRSTASPSGIESKPSSVGTGRDVDGIPRKGFHACFGLADFEQKENLNMGQLRLVQMGDLTPNSFDYLPSTHGP